jgi:RimJ/RimL family protein N-acetyltransferase
MVGHVGFHGPQSVNGRDPPAALELACTVFAAYRGRGYAREAVAALVDWAWSVHGIRHFLGSIAPGNEPSMRSSPVSGFVDAGQR